MSYRKGANRERQVMKLLEEKEFLVTRAAGSHGAADLIALKKGQIFLIQVKRTKSKWSGFGPKEREELCNDAELAGGQAVLAWWPPNRPLQWIYPMDWPKPPKGYFTESEFLQSLHIEENLSFKS